MTLPRNQAALTLLRLPAVLYAGATRIRNRYYDLPSSRQAAGLPVISVGNLTVGGTGKTPVVQWLCRQLLADGESPAVVTRGYGGNAGAGPLVVSRGQGPEESAERCGDEPYLLADSLKQVLVVAGSNRIAGAREARKLGATVVILDDGFQHRRLHRELDILLLDHQDPLGNGRLLPAGPLREHPSGIGRAGIVLLTRWEAGRDPAACEALVRQFNPSAPILSARHEPAGFTDRTGQARMTPGSVIAFCGIARPDSFRHSLERAGVTVDGFHAFGDHHPYRDDELTGLAAASAAAGSPLATTGKDLARLSHRKHPAVSGMLALGLDLVIESGDRLMQAVRGVLAGRDAS